jgi:hypothetical protein
VANSDSAPLAGSAKRAVHTAAERAVHTAARSRTLAALARVGLVSWGIVHLTLAWICAEIAFGRHGGDADQAGALSTLAANPGGTVLLCVIAVGFLAFAGWQVTEAVRGHTERPAGRQRIAYRLVSAGRAGLFGALAVTSATFVLGDRSADSAEKQESLTAGLLALPGGQLLVGGIGLAVVVTGGVLVYQGVTKRFREHLDTATMPAGVEHPTDVLGLLGYSAKGAVLGIAGALVIGAAATFDPDKSRGLDAALKTLGEQPFGKVLLCTVAAGLACFGVYSLVDARYRRIG